MAKSKKPGGGDYEIGYGKPPKSGQFKPGQSGNPGGRKKDDRNLRTTLGDVFGQPIEISENGRKQRVSLLRALVLRLAQEGLKGNVRAIEGILDRMERIELAGAGRAQDETVEDAALLERYVQAQVQAALAEHLRQEPALAERPESEGDGDV